MKTLRITFGSLVVVGVIAGIFLTLLWLLSDVALAVRVFELAPLIAAVTIFIVLVLTWSLTDSFAIAAVAALIEGLIVYGVIRIILSGTISSHEHALWMAERNPTADPYNPSTDVIFLMVFIVVAFLFWWGIAAPSEEETPQF